MDKEGGRVFIAAAGTGGHIFPGLAVASGLASTGYETVWIGTPYRMEAKLVPEYGYPIEFIDVKGVRGNGFFKLLTAPWVILKSIIKSLRLIRKHRPKAVFIFGGFVSGPVGIACLISRTPLIVHEQNAKPGFTNGILAKYARTVLTAFPNVFPRLKSVQYTGNPIRHTLTELPPPAARFAQRGPHVRLLVLGGSQGAHFLNVVMRATIAQLIQTVPSIKLMVHHQTGQQDYEATLAGYESLGVEAIVQPFITDMESAYAAADFVVARSGALTVTEIATVGIGALFIPLPTAVDDHQTLNAQVLVDKDAAILCQQSTASAAGLSDLLIPVITERAKMLAMANQAYSWSHAGALDKILKVFKKVVRSA